MKKILVASVCVLQMSCNKHSNTEDTVQVIDKNIKYAICRYIDCGLHGKIYAKYIVVDFEGNGPIVDVSIRDQIGVIKSKDFIGYATYNKVRILFTGDYRSYFIKKYAKSDGNNNAMLSQFKNKESLYYYETTIWVFKLNTNKIIDYYPKDRMNNCVSRTQITTEQ
jgi:hypothetical protein